MAFLACIRCGVEINAESAVDGNRCARCPAADFAKALGFIPHGPVITAGGRALVSTGFEPGATPREPSFFWQNDHRALRGSAPEVEAPADLPVLVQAEPLVPPPAELETPPSAVPVATPRRRGGR